MPGTLADLDTEFLHDLRVAVRRARAVLRELEGVHEAGQRAHVRDELKWIQALDRPGPRPRRPAARLGRARRAARRPSAPRSSSRCATLLQRRRAREFTRLRRGPAQRALRRGAGGLARARDDRARRTRGPMPTVAIERGRGRPDPARLPPDGARRLGDRRRQPGRGAPRPAQARQGAALPARAVRRPVRAEGRQADGQDAQGPPGRARPTSRTARWRATCCATSATSSPPSRAARPR